MQGVDQVTAVIEDIVRSAVERGVDMRVVAVAVNTVTGEGGDTVLGDQRGGGVVLCGQRVRRAQGELGATSRERPHEVGRLGRHMHTGRDLCTLERLFDSEPVANLPEYRHGPVRPFDSGLALLGQGEIGYVVLGQVRHWGSPVNGAAGVRQRGAHKR